MSPPFRFDDSSAAITQFYHSTISTRPSRLDSPLRILCSGCFSQMPAFDFPLSNTAPVGASCVQIVSTKKEIQIEASRRFVRVGGLFLTKLFFLRVFGVRSPPSGHFRLLRSLIPILLRHRLCTVATGVQSASGCFDFFSIVFAGLGWEEE